MALCRKCQAIPAFVKNLKHTAWRVRQTQNKGLQSAQKWLSEDLKVTSFEENSRLELSQVSQYDEFMYSLQWVKTANMDTSKGGTQQSSQIGLTVKTCTS